MSLIMAQNENLSNNTSEINPHDTLLQFAKDLKGNNRQVMIESLLNENKEAIKILKDKKIPIKDIVDKINLVYAGKFEYKINANDLTSYIKNKLKNK